MPHTQLFNTAGAGSWICPQYCTSVTVECWGGGGGGGKGNTLAAGGGGGGGAWASSTIAVVPNTTYALNIGAGGASNTGTGGNTTFNTNVVVAAGGTGGAAGTGGLGLTQGAGGAGGTTAASTGNSKLAGSTGTTGGAGGAGGAGTNYANAGNPGIGGAGGAANGNGIVGNKGAIYLTWVEQQPYTASAPASSLASMSRKFSAIRQLMIITNPAAVSMARLITAFRSFNYTASGTNIFNRTLAAVRSLSYSGSGWNTLTRTTGKNNLRSSTSGIATLMRALGKTFSYTSPVIYIFNRALNKTFSYIITGTNIFKRNIISARRFTYTTQGRAKSVYGLSSEILDRLGGGSVVTTVTRIFGVFD